MSTTTTPQPTDIRKLMAGKRFEPKTPQQWEQAEAGAAACDQDYPGGNVKYGDALIGANKYWRAGYELRYHEILAAQHEAIRGRVAQMAAHLADLERYPPQENTWDGKCCIDGYEVKAHQGLFAQGSDQTGTFGAYFHRGCLAQVKAARQAAASVNR